MLELFSLSEANSSSEMLVNTLQTIWRHSLPNCLVYNLCREKRKLRYSESTAERLWLLMMSQFINFHFITRSNYKKTAEI